MLVVALSSVLIAAVGVAMGSLRHALGARVDAMVGEADVRVQARGTGTTFPARIAERIASLPQVERIAPRLDATLSLRFTRPVWTKPEGSPLEFYTRSRQTFQVSARVFGIAQDDAQRLAGQVRLLDGRMPAGEGEIVIDSVLAQRLSRASAQPRLGDFGLSLLARGSGEFSTKDPGPETTNSSDEARILNDRAVPKVGDWVEFVRVGQQPVRLTIVGIAQPPPLGGNPRSFMTLPAMAELTGQRERVSRVDVMLRGGGLSASDAQARAQAFVDTLAPQLPPDVLAQTSQRLTTGFDRGVRANTIGFLLANLMAFLAAGFIICTGMSTGIVERLRELAILRCIGATRGQLALSQLVAGGLIGAGGATLGVPIGVAAAYALLHHYREELASEPTIVWWRVGVAFGGAVLAGLIGAALPALQASRISPLEALASRARPARTRTLRLVTTLGLAGVATHLAIFTLISDADAIFYAYIVLGLPALMIGYFALGVPVTRLVARILGGLIERALKLPPQLLRRSARVTPFRFGFTASAMMAGLAMMVAIWTQGGAAMRDWIGRIQFPDAFVVGLNIPPQAQNELAQLPFVTETCAISLHPVETEAFGVRGLTRVKTFFVAFDPAPFFRMSTIDWIQGDPAQAIPRLEQGGAVIVSREFLVARSMGLGDTFVCWDDAGAEHRFEIVGVVSSPGLEIANNFFDVSEDFATEQRLHAVFGSRKDLRERFNTDAIGLIQFSIDPAVPDTVAMPQVRERLIQYGIINAGSGREIRETILTFMRTALRVTTAVAVFAMLVSCFGVANLVIAGVHARTFEFGVLRAVGAQRGLLARFILGEALIIAVAACILGTLMGLQGAFGGVRLDAMIWGIDLRLIPPILPILAGWGFVTLMCVGAALPTALALARREPRELLGAMKG